MAVTKILARHAPVKALIQYALNGDKTNEQVLTAALNCSTEFAARRMQQTKAQYHQEDGVQCYHIIQSFQPGEVTPELALEIAQAFAKEHLRGYEVVIGTHVDRHHVHSHSLQLGQCGNREEVSQLATVLLSTDSICF